MKTLISAFALLFISASVFSDSAFAAREVQNGGTGLRVDGGFLTYYSAQGALRQPVELTERIPGLELLIKELIALPMGSESKIELLKNFDFTEQRRYYRLMDGSLDSRLREKIITDYATLMKIPAENVVIFAITNTSDLSTVLLPEFYALRPTEQAAIIVHESLWLTRDATYEKVIYGEQITQAYLEDTSSPEKFYRFINLLNPMVRDVRFKLRAGLYFDLKHQRLSPSVQATQKMLLKDLIGEKFITSAVCDLKESFDFYSELSRNLYLDSRFNYELKDKSLFFTSFFEYLQERGSLKLEYKTDCSKSEFLNKAMNDSYVDLSALLSREENRLLIQNSKGKTLGYLTFEIR